jgi:hypothetical protein
LIGGHGGKKGSADNRKNRDRRFPAEDRKEEPDHLVFLERPVGGHPDPALIDVDPEPPAGKVLKSAPFTVYQIERNRAYYCIGRLEEKFTKNPGP